MREEGGRRLDGGQEFTIRIEVVDQGAVLVADPEPARGVEDQAFAVDADSFPARAGATEAVAGVGRSGEGREVGVRECAGGVRVEASDREAVGSCESDGVEVVEGEIGW